MFVIGIACTAKWIRLVPLLQHHVILDKVRKRGLKFTRVPVPSDRRGGGGQGTVGCRGYVATGAAVLCCADRTAAVEGGR